MIKKFHASTTREALRQVRDALGANAIILSNRQVSGGVEIMAVADMDMAALTSQPTQKHAPQSVHVEPEMPAAIRSNRAPIPPAPAATPAPRESPREIQRAQQTVNAKPAVQAEREPALEGVVQDIVREVKSLRGMLEGQLAGFAWGDMQRREPVKLEVLRHMLAAGFGSTLSRQLLEKMPDGYDYTKAIKWVKAALTHNLRCVAPGEDIIERGGCYALVGPTGVGKTTTVAKLAARATLKHGPSSLALITTDSYRIGAQDQLRIYGRILGVPVYAIKEEADLQMTLADVQNKHLVLIDTVGMSQRDRRMAEQVALLCGNGKRVKRLLLISATSQGSTLEDVARAYQGPGLEGCILTKIDEALSLGFALDVSIRHQLKLHFVTNGQRVPEDMHLANPLYLVDRAMKALQDAASPFALQDADYPLMMAAMAANERPSSSREAYGS
jgi:flagellar biosynthesis protein FlhF